MNKNIFYIALITFCFSSANAETNRQFEPAPKDENGRYTNQDPNWSKGSTGINIGFLLRRFGTVLRDYQGLPKHAANNGEWLRANQHQSTVTWVGHSTLLVQIDGINFLTDPMWSKTASPVPPIGPRRLVKLGLAIEDLPPIDFVVISHNHYDHMDVPTLKKLFTINPDTVFFVPMDNAKLLRKKGIKKVQQMDWGESIEFKNLVIHCLPSQHWSKRSLNDTNKSGWASWAMTSANKRFYFAGDSGYFDGFKTIGEALGPFDLAAMPIGAYKPQTMMQSSHMDPEQAVQATLDIQASKAVAIHFGTFDLADEPINEPPQRFKQAAQEQLGQKNSWVLAIGETREF
jgi:N-acyl-phosphatidylethanolamine-hydrolysing phospholipase D